MSSSDGTERVQTVRSAWINRLRDEALRMRRQDVCKIAHIGFIIATFADADGSNAFPSTATVAAIAGASQETVARCMKVLIGTGLVERKRRPNRNAVTQLVIPMGPVPWDKHLHKYGETRQAKARREAKAKELAEHLAKESAEKADGDPSGDGFRNPSPAVVPEPVPGGVTNYEIGDVDRPGTRPRTGSEPVPGGVPEPVPGGGDHVLPTCGRDPHTDHDLAEPGPQPQVGAGAGAREEDDSSPETDRLDDIAARIVAAGSLEPPRLQSLPGGAKAGRADVQPPLLMSVGDDPATPGPRRVTAAERDELRAAGAADLTRVLRAIDQLGEPTALALYGGRLVSGAHNERARTTRTHTGT